MSVPSFKDAKLLLLISSRLDYKLGSGLGCGFCGMIIVLSLGMHFVLEKENKRRDRKYGKPFEHERLDISSVGDDHPKYRYLT